MKHLALTLTTALLTLSSPAYAQQEAEGSLARARGLFTKVDTNGDGLVSALEAGRNRIPSKEFVVYDADRDRKLSKSEFTLFYRQLLVKAGKDIQDDLEAESARIEASRRAKKATDAERTEAARQKALEEARRAAKGRDDKQATDAARAQKARQEQQEADARRAAAARKDAEPVPVSTPPAEDAANGLTDEQRAALARAEQEAADAARAERARQEDLSQNAARSEQARLAKLRQDEARAEEARLQKQRQDALRTEKARQEKLAQDAARAEKARVEARRAARGATPTATPAERRADGYVKRLVDGGRLTAAQARDFRMVLSAPAVGSTGAVAPKTLRAALSAAKKRISTLVVSGALSSEEGRQLSAALDARAKAALPAQEEGPAARRRRGQDGGSKKGAGTRRVGEVKDAGTVRPRRDG